jgi:hypothetical protein
MLLGPIIIAIVVVGFLLWLVNSYIPMQPTIKTIVNAVVIIVLVVWLLHVFGVWQYLSTIHV